jgi:hypothetical protein
MRQKTMKDSFTRARAVAHTAVAKLPPATVEGFRRGRKAGHEAVENLPYLAGAAVGFVYGAGEAVVDALVTSVSTLIGCTDALETEE